MILRVWTNFPFSGSKGWTNFYNILNSNSNIDFAEINNIELVDYAISFNHTDSNLREIVKCDVPISKRILVMLECEAILPKMHEKKTLNEYGLIISPSRYWAPQHEKIIINYPLISNLSSSYKNDFESRKHKFGIIQSNKYSCIKGEMYTFRRRVIKEFRKRNISLELRGKNWDKSVIVNLITFYRILRVNLKKTFFSKLIFIPKSVLGIRSRESVSEKSKDVFLASIKYAVVIENSLDYVSEKLFDCFKAGTVPIYIGPNLEEFGIPADTAIVAPSNISGLFDIISNIDAYPHKSILENGKKFLLSGGQSWTELQSLANIANILSQKVSNEI